MVYLFFWFLLCVVRGADCLAPEAVGIWLRERFEVDVGPLCVLASLPVGVPLYPEARQQIAIYVRAISLSYFFFPYFFIQSFYQGLCVISEFYSCCIQCNKFGKRVTF